MVTTTGHYRLDLRLATARSVAQQLLQISRDEAEEHGWVAIGAHHTTMYVVKCQVIVKNVYYYCHQNHNERACCLTT